MTMEIPMNQVKDEKEELIGKIVDNLRTNDDYTSWRYDDGVALSLAEEVCKAFVSRGYHAKIDYFCDGRSSYQKFVVSKYYCQSINARMVYSDIIG